MTTSTPEIFVLGGPNGAGKSTTAKVLLPHQLQLSQFVNADYFAQALSPFDPWASAFEAGRLMIQRIRELRAARASFAFETTLASRTFVPFLRDAQQAGYLIFVIYVWISTPNLALQRVQHRVQLGGHDVPSHIVKRRYWRSLQNFFNLYQPLANSWTICDNTRKELSIVARGQSDGTSEALDPQKYDAIKQSLADAP